MSDLVVAVRLTADGSGLVGQLKVSKAALDELSGAEKTASGAARELETATDAAGNAQVQAAGKARAKAQADDESARAARAAAAAARDEEAALAKFLAIIDPTAAAQANLNQQLALANQLYNNGRLDLQQLNALQGALTNEMAGHTRGVGLQRAAYQQLGFQVQDVFASYASGINPLVILAQQAGQTASAIAMLADTAEGADNKFVQFATFLAGPWGAALLGATTVVALLVAKFWEVDDAQSQAAIATDSFADAQGRLSKVINLVTEALEGQNGVLREAIRLQAFKDKNAADEAAKEAASDLKSLRLKSDTRAALQFAGDPMSGGMTLAREEAERKPDQDALNQILREYLATPATDPKLIGDATTKARKSIEALQAAGRLGDLGVLDVTEKIIELGEKRNESLASQGIIDAIDGKGLASFLKKDPPKGARPKKDNAAREAERLAEFGERAEDAIARLNDQFNTAPRDIDRARAATAQLDDIIADLEKRQPPNFATLIAQAKAIKPLIADGLARPIRDMIADQEREIDIGRLRVQGRQNDAQALILTNGLMDRLGVETEEQLAIELKKRGVREEEIRQMYDNLDVMRAQTRELEIQQENQQTYLSALGDIRANIRQTIADLASGDGKAINFLKRLKDTATNVFADILTEKLFGGMLRDLEDQITGQDKVTKAGDRIASAVDKASDSIRALGEAAQSGAAALSDKGTGPVPEGWIVDEDTGKPFDPNAPIEVVGKKPDILSELKGGFKAGYEEVLGGFKTGIKDIFGDIFGEKGLFDATLSKSLGRGVAGAQLGVTVGKGITDALGAKGSTSGAALGGAAGSFLEGPLNSLLSGLGPFGSVIGGLLGSLLGGALKSAKTGSATITSVDGEATTSGNNEKRKEAASGLAGSVQDALKQIADEFGGGVGSFAVSIGIRDKDFRVDPSGSGATKVKKGAVDFGDNEAAAISFAIKDAIADGAITGLSDAIKKALNSSKDLEEALEEALKVRDVEYLLAGLQGELNRQFKAFENQAKDRLRIATDYGFDIVEIEKRNAEDRAQLVDEILQTRVGSLQSLLKDLDFGNLFEGSLTDQRDKLLAQIATARTDAEAGKDGAADTLADLSRRLVELSREAYGTAGGEYAADRSGAISAAEAVIEAENERIKAAQDAAVSTATKVEEGNKLQSETNDLLAQIKASIDALGSYGAVRQAGTNGFDLASVYRQAGVP